MASWEVRQEPEIVPVPIDSTLFKEILAEIARILYASQSQLNEDRSVLTNSIEQDSPNKRRTA